MAAAIAESNLVGYGPNTLEIATAAARWLCRYNGQRGTPKQVARQLTFPNQIRVARDRGWIYEIGGES